MRHPNNSFERPSTLPSLDDLREARYQQMLEMLKELKDTQTWLSQVKDHCTPKNSDLMLGLEFRIDKINNMITKVEKGE